MCRLGIERPHREQTWVSVLLALRLCPTPYTVFPWTPFRSRVLAEMLASVVSNLHAFYCQHQAVVNGFISPRKAALEKKLSVSDFPAGLFLYASRTSPRFSAQDQVKIHKWDEQSYYSLKTSTEKAHAVLHKLVRLYVYRRCPGLHFVSVCFCRSASMMKC